MAKLPIKQIFKFGFGALDDLGMFSPTEKAIDTLTEGGQTKFRAEDLLRYDPESKSGYAGRLSKFGRGVSDEMMFTGLEDYIVNVPTGQNVTSKELKDYLAKNKTRVDETIKNEMKALEAGQIDIFQEFKDIGYLMSDRLPTGTPTQRRVFLKNLAQDVTEGRTDRVKQYMDMFNPEMTGDIESPNVTISGFNDMSKDMQDSIMVKNKPKIQELEKEGFPDPETYIKETELDDAKFITIEFRDFGDGENSVDTTYGITGNDNYGYDILVDGKKNTGLGIQPNLNEAILNLNYLRRASHDTIFNDKRITKDLLPMHEKDTLPGGENYNEIILSMPEPPDVVENVITDWKNAITPEENTGFFNIRLPYITGSPSDTRISSEEFKLLKQGKPIQIDTNQGKRTIRINKDDKLELLKEDFTQESHTSDEKNVVIFTRTKDRTDRDGKKILYVEEMQSDISQQGRDEGLLMGIKEKKSFINKNNPIIFGEILDEIQKLKDTTNIDNLIAVKGTRYQANTNRMPEGDTFVEFKSDTEKVLERILPDFGVEREEQLRTMFKKAKSIEDVIKQKMTKYKYLPIKDKAVRYLSNAGIDKNNASLIDKATLEDRNIVIPDNLYTDVSDYVDTSYITGRIGEIKSKVFGEHYAREIDKWLKGFKDKNIEPTQADKNKFKKNFIRNNVSKDKLDEIDKDIKDDVAEFYYMQDISGIDTYDIPKKERRLPLSKKKDDDDLYLAEMTIDLLKTHYRKTRGKDLKLKKVPIEKDDFGKDTKEVISKKQFVELQTEIAEDKYYDDLTYGTTLKNPRIEERLKNFDYDITKSADILKNLYNLEKKLEKADAFEVKLNPISNIPSGPFVGTTERFTELGIKRLMKYAVDNDYDGISFSKGIIHANRWGEPELAQYYDTIIPKVAKTMLKGTDAQLENKTIFSDKLFLDRFNKDTLNYEDHFPEDYDFIEVLEEGMDIQTDGGYIKDSPTIYLTPNLKDYVKSGVSLYTPIVATGLAGAVTSQILGSEEDIIKEEVF